MYSYIVTINASGDVLQITRNDGTFIAWNDPDFTAWNAQQQAPFTLSALQTQLKQYKAMSPATWSNGTSVTAAQKDRVLYELLQRATLGVI